MIENYHGWLEKLNMKFDLVQLLADYEKVAPFMVDVKPRTSDVLVQQKHHLILNNLESDLYELVPYTKTAVETLREVLDFSSVTYRVIKPNTAYTWHSDKGSICLHIPLVTNSGCFFIYEDKHFRMPATGDVYVVNNRREHTFVNSGVTDRLHLTFENLMHG